MSNLDLMRVGIGPAVVIGITFTAVAGYALLTTFDGTDGLTVVPELLMPVLFGGLTVAAAASARRVAPKPRTRVRGLDADRTTTPLTPMFRSPTRRATVSSRAF